MSTHVNDQADGWLDQVAGEWQLRFDLAEEDGGTVLTLVSTLGELGTAARAGAGWQVCLDMLGHALAGTPLPWTGEQRWRQLHPAYVSQFGPAAATIGPPAGHPVLDEDSRDGR